MRSIPRSHVAVVSPVAASATVVDLLAAKEGRLGASIFNDSTADLYVKAGSGATTSDFTVKLTAGAYWEAPYHYSGVLTGIWASADGSALVTEYT